MSVEPAGYWVSCDEALPLLGVRVRVHGQYTPAGSGNPVAYLRQYRRTVRWESTQWRGTCGITFWYLTRIIA